MQQPLTDRRYWDEVWTGGTAKARTPAPRLEVNRVNRWLERELSSRLRPGAAFLEVGAGGSPWPAHVAQSLGAQAWGIDFSRPGLEQAASACAPGATVRLVEGDLFDRSLLPLGHFQVVYSGGFLEHFVDPRPVAERLRELCAPGGVVVTTVPNLAGLNGRLQRAVDPAVFAAHVIYTPAALDAAHTAGRLEPVAPASFLGVLDLGAVNFMRLARRLPAPVLRGVWFLLSRLKAGGEWLAAHGGPGDGGRMLAPSIGGVYRPSPAEPTEPGRPLS